MPGYLKSSLTLAQSQDIARERFVNTNTTVFSLDNPPRFYSVQMVFLCTTTSSGKKLSIVKSQKNDTRKTRFMEVEKYHRFILLARRDNEEVFAMFTVNAVESHSIFRYQASIKPGTLVNVLNPKLEGLLKSTNTTLISTIEPLVPIVEGITMNLALPHSLEIATFRYFEFVTTTLRIVSATATENVCPGMLCDAQTVLQNCGCLAVASKRIWALTLVLECNELNPLEEVDTITITSNSATDLFVSTLRQDQSPNCTDFDTFALDDSVQEICGRINDAGGFILKGWFKPNLTDDGATHDVKRIHVCCVKARNELTQDIIDQKY